MAAGDTRYYSGEVIAGPKHPRIAKRRNVAVEVAIGTLLL